MFGLVSKAALDKALAERDAARDDARTWKADRDRMALQINGHARQVERIHAFHGDVEQSLRDELAKTYVRNGLGRFQRHPSAEVGK